MWWRFALGIFCGYVASWITHVGKYKDQLRVEQVDVLLDGITFDARKRIAFKNELVRQGIMEPGYVHRKRF